MNKVDKYDVIILGAGAAGLFCAITAARRGLSVLVLEKSNKVGKKILMSGGGRCNFTNLFISAENFISSNSHFCKSALARFTQWDFIDLVEKYNIEYEERKHGQLFCINSSKDILSMLLRECDDAGVQIKTHVDLDIVENLSTSESFFKLSLSHTGQEIKKDEVFCKSLVVATGALSIPTLGGSGRGYDIAGQFGVKLRPRSAGLVPLMFDGSMKEFCESLSGVSIKVEISCEGKTFEEQLLFTHRGISGPAVLQISNYWKKGVAVEINLMPKDDAAKLLRSFKDKNPSKNLNNSLKSYFPKALIFALQKVFWPDSEDTLMAEFSNKELSAIGEKLNKWIICPSESEGYRKAEVTLGGVDTDELSSKSMECKRQSGLFFIGEVVDVTGHLGGYNFQWAWSSGYAAGLSV